MRTLPRRCYPCPLFAPQTELEGKNMKPLRFAWIIRAALTACAFAAAPAGASTGFERCPQFFVHGQVPKVHRLESVRPRALCFSSFAVMYSGLTKTPLYVAERLSASQVARAREERRTNRFFADARLPSVERAELADYKGSGFDRGHMAPAGDMSNDVSMAQSFSLANMVPQAPENNRKTWAGIEKPRASTSCARTGMCMSSPARCSSRPRAPSAPIGCGCHATCTSSSTMQRRIARGPTGFRIPIRPG